MHSYTLLMRTGICLASTSLTIAVVTPAEAQPVSLAGSTQPEAGQAGDQGTDPPALAGRLAALTGSVSFHAAGETQWTAATLNYPVTNGEAFWTEPQAQATLEIADDRIVLDGSTELDVTALDQSQLSATAAQGAVFVQLNDLPPGQTVTFTTPRGAIQISAIGRYEIVAGDTNDATTVTVVEGAAHVSGTNLALDVGPQQTATVGGSDTLQGSVGAIQQDAFLQAMLRVPVRPHLAASVPHQVRYMTGAADLQSYGSFSQTAQYGQVWYPRDVDRNWAPYRDGHWAYVHPWGWTWVDNARWGFAPFHYGRWVQVENRWGWVPGQGDAGVAGGSLYPVYSPALVSFVNVGGAALAGAAIGFAAGEPAGGYAPAWIPLGPREPYYPWYHCRSDYFGRINAPYGVPHAIIERGPTYISTTTNIRNVTINRTTNVFINQRAATVLPAAAFARGASVASLGRPLPERALLAAQPVVGRMAVTPTAQTPNLTAATARRYNVVLPATPVHSISPGPRIVPAAAHLRGVPELRRAALPQDVHAVPASQAKAGPAAMPRPHEPSAAVEAGNPVRPGMLPTRPGVPEAAHGAALPALRSPGASRPAPAPLDSHLNPGNGAAPRRAAPLTARRSEVPTAGQPVHAVPYRAQTGLPGPRPDRADVAHVPQPRSAESKPLRSFSAAEHPGAIPAPQVAVPRVLASHAVPRPEAPRPPAPRPPARIESPHPSPAERPAPHVEAPHVQAVRPGSQTTAPRQKAPAPRPAPAPDKKKPN